MLPNILNLSFNRTQVFKIIFEVNSSECRVGKITHVFTRVTWEHLAGFIFLPYVTSFFMQIFKLLENFIEIFQE